MNDKILKMLEITEDIHRPIPLDENEMAENRLVQKEVLETRLIDDMEDLATWKPITKYIRLELSEERCVSGSHSLKFVCPTNLNGWGPNADLVGDSSGVYAINATSEEDDQLVNHMYNPGRIYAVPSAMRVVDREDWSDWNRLSAWIFPVAPGMKTITMRMQLHNDGVRKVPDKYERDGAHNMNLKGNEWNHVVLEMPYLDRDCVTGVSFDYDMVGHEPDAVDHVTFFLDKLELQKVKCDVYEGWIPAEDRISYSNSGYQTGSEKTAVASGIQADTFKLIETKTGRIVLEKKIDLLKGKVGDLQVMDFSEIMEQGEYIIVAGDHSTRVFAISDDVWESSIWKMLNFFLVLRCGHEVYGKHRCCHGDSLLKHGDLSIVGNGGWHDAGDLAQGLNNTIEATIALLELAKSVKEANPRLFKRVLEEAKWGLDYTLKMRFGDGYRLSYFSCSIWTDGVIGTHDDIVSEPGRSAYTNFDAAYAEALGALMFAEIDADYSRYCLKIAKEDYDFGVEILNEVQNAKSFDGFQPQFSIGDYMDVQVYSIGALAAAKLYELTNEQRYETQAHDYAKTVIACQQQEVTDWDVPMVGFYYQDAEKDLIWHHNHMSYAYLPDLAMKVLCDTFPASADYMEWYTALALSGEYYKTIASHTAPYGIIPAGVYHEDEADLGTKTTCSHPMMDLADCKEAYKPMVQKGFPLGKGYYLRVYPVWFSFRGNYNVQLSEGKSMSTIAHIRNDYDLYTASQKQFEWIVGKNPTCQSTMYGEGYDYIQLYAVQPGQTVGAISVGMESHFDIDAPYWPQVNNATYKEVWVCPATKWMWGMADTFTPAAVNGYIKLQGNGDISFIHQATQKTYTVTPHSRTGYFEINLPAGKYTMQYGDMQRELLVISGKRYVLDGAIYDMQVASEKKAGKIILNITVKGEASLPITIKAYNIDGLIAETIVSVVGGQGKAALEGTVVDINKPCVAIIIPNNNLSDTKEVLFLK